MIELVTVIVIIGILAAMAIPRFANLREQATIASNQAMAGALKAALSNAHVAWIAAGSPSADSNAISLEGGSVLINNNGWPSGGWGVSNLTIPRSSCTTLFLSPSNKIVINAPQVQYYGSGTGSCTENPCYYVADIAVNGVCTFQLYNGPAPANPAHGIYYNYITGEITTY